MNPCSHERKLLSCSVPQFPHLQSRVTDMPSSLVHSRIRCVSDQEMLRMGPSLWRMLRKWGAKAHDLTWAAQGLAVCLRVVGHLGDHAGQRGQPGVHPQGPLACWLGASPFGCVTGPCLCWRPWPLSGWLRAHCLADIPATQWAASGARFSFNAQCPWQVIREVSSL